MNYRISPEVSLSVKENNKQKYLNFIFLEYGGLNNERHTEMVIRFYNLVTGTCSLIFKTILTSLLLNLWHF